MINSGLSWCLEKRIFRPVLLHAALGEALGVTVPHPSSISLQIVSGGVGVIL